MALEKDRQIPELYNLKHMQDNLPYRHFPYEDVILQNSTTPYLQKNPVMYGFILSLEKIITLMIEKNVVMRNYFNFTVNKYYDDHWG
jgi:hypothetical protein